MLYVIVLIIIYAHSVTSFVTGDHDDSDRSTTRSSRETSVITVNNETCVEDEETDTGRVLHKSDEDIQEQVESDREEEEESDTSEENDVEEQGHQDLPDILKSSSRTASRADTMSPALSVIEQMRNGRQSLGFNISFITPDSILQVYTV